MGETFRVGSQNQPSPRSRRFSPSTLESVRDNGKVLYDRISSQGYKECQDVILAVSGMAEDIRDALLDYRVGNDTPYAAVMLLNRAVFTDGPATGDI